MRECISVRGMHGRGKHESQSLAILNYSHNGLFAIEINKAYYAALVITKQEHATIQFKI